MFKVLFFQSRFFYSLSVALSSLSIFSSLIFFPSFTFSQEKSMQPSSVHDSNPHNSSAHQAQDKPTLPPISKEKALAEFQFLASQIEIDPIRALPVHNNGRLKPLDTLSREIMVYINGSYRRFGVKPVQAYLAFTRYENAGYIEVIEVRDLAIRLELGFSKEKRFFSLSDFHNTQIEALTEPILKKQQENSRALTSRDKALLEVLQQASLFSEILSGQHLMRSADYTFLNEEQKNSHELMGSNPEVQESLKKYFQALSSPSANQKQAAEKLLASVRSQKTPDLFKHALEKMDVEVFYNQVQFFLWSSFLSLFFGICFFVPLFKNKISFKITTIFYLLPISLLLIGLILRTYITQFAPVTNMYTTMIWVAFGVLLFSFLLFVLYKNYILPGLALITSGLLLLLTYQIPLILSPDMDPIVAVLRNNFWLSTHVTTITISYAAFTIAMVLGNVALIRLWLFKNNEAFFKEYSHYAYRMIQLGCFLLTIGIILGGIWADYSWGRFWGWDPKETWSLIADLGFLAIMHARLVGWINAFTLLAWSPVAYLLVVMAWYGVNFVLAAGLHSYGFSSGGASAMGIFIVLQVSLLIIGFIKIKSNQRLSKHPKEELPQHE